jgi:hypothetical protein
MAGVCATSHAKGHAIDMRTVPRNILPRIGFFKSHVGKWAENAAALGLTEAEVATMAAKTEATRAALAAQRAAQQAARSATLMMRQADREMSRMGRSILQRIRGQAAVAGNSVYALASVRPPKKGSKIAPPGKPSAFTIELQEIGWLTLRWTCKNPRGSTGTIYHVWRAPGIDQPFQYLGAVGERKFVDQRLPAGAARIVYKVQAMRSTAVGEAAEQTVNLASDRSMPAAMLRMSGKAARLVA